MGTMISESTRRRLDVQGLTDIDDATLADTVPWQRMAFGVCALLAGVGTALASPLILVILMPLAALGALFSVHPVDLIYNHGIRHLRGTGPLPRRAPQTRFACGLGTVWLGATAWAFWSGAMGLGYALGLSLTVVATPVATTDICIPSMIFNALFRRSAA